MKVFQVEDAHTGIVESVLDAISRCPDGAIVDSFAFGMVYSDRQYTTGYVDANPRDLSDIAGYIMLDANLRYMIMCKDKYEEDEGDGKDS